MGDKGGSILDFVESLSRKMEEYMYTHGLPSPTFRVYVDGGSRVIMESERSRRFPRSVKCVFTPPTYTVMVEGRVITYDTLLSHDGFRVEERILNTLFEVMLEYVIED